MVIVPTLQLLLWEMRIAMLDCCWAEQQCVLRVVSRVPLKGCGATRFPRIFWVQMQYGIDNHVL